MLLWFALVDVFDILVVGLMVFAVLGRLVRVLSCGVFCLDIVVQVGVVVLCWWLFRIYLVTTVVGGVYCGG